MRYVEIMTIKKVLTWYVIIVIKKFFGLILTVKIVNHNSKIKSQDYKTVDYCEKFNIFHNCDFLSNSSDFVIILTFCHRFDRLCHNYMTFISVLTFYLTIIAVCHNHDVPNDLPKIFFFFHMSQK